MSTKPPSIHERAQEACCEAIDANAMAAGIHALLSTIPDEETTDSILAARQLALLIEGKMKSILELI
ncbi:hypothetical protein [Dechloromonas denitrificans]|uniref:hypothetical protein n=1 Tax=Dechloromonas denitrificans TaxID=281362 RepID=UPI0012F76EA6|nr:hypothetical protein [Dechloromonas denitrificans]